MQRPYLHAPLCVLHGREKKSPKTALEDTVMQRMRIVISTGGRSLPEMFAYFFISQFASVLGVSSKEFVLKAEGSERRWAREFG